MKLSPMWSGPVDTGSLLGDIGRRIDGWESSRGLSTALNSASSPAMGLSPLLPLAYRALATPKDFAGT